jgi:hypothetical protein
MSENVNPTNTKPTTEVGEPVPGFPIKFEWQTGIWREIFDKHVDFIQQDILRALAAERLVVYLSCPISSRGGSIDLTNVEIADYTARRLVAEWGTRFWFLNPGQYQLESKQGTGLIYRHAYLIGLEKGIKIDVDELKKKSPPTGGDYMRMWTRVLVEDGTAKPLGSRFSAYYFIGPSDYRQFFTQGGLPLTAGIEEYFGRKYATDREFNTYFSPPFVDDKGNPLDEKLEWERRRREFVRYYAVKAGAYFSKGSHDEWNIWFNLNKLRLGDKSLGVGNQIPGFFEGRQVDPGAAEQSISPGYASQPKIENIIPPVSESSSASKAIESLATQTADAKVASE